MAVKHTFVSSKADGADDTLVRPSNWNANHTIDDGTITYGMLATLPSFLMSSTTKTWIVTIGDDGTFNTVEVLSEYSLDFSQAVNSFYLYLL